MTEDSRSPKRRRLSTGPEAIVINILAPEESSNLENGQEGYTRDVDFWLEDGNLILLAGPSAFRVYRGLLAKKSPVFADMFAAGSADATETFDGCPVVRLQDHPHDLRDFLQYLMPCSTLTLVKGVPQRRFEQLHAAFHLAHKYQCQDVEARVLFVLSKYYTSDFIEHDGYGASKYTLPPPQATIAAINIARLTDTPSMLPFALYLACTLEGCVMDGYKRRDGSVEHLSAHDLRLCLDARGALGRELDNTVKNMFRPGPSFDPECTATKSCPTISGILYYAQEEVPGACTVMVPWRDSIDGWVGEHDLCTACKRTLLQREREERRVVWMKLPGIFGFTVKGCSFTSGDE